MTAPAYIYAIADPCRRWVQVGDLSLADLKALFAPDFDIRHG